MLNEFSKKEAPIQGLAGVGGGVPSRLLTLASGTTTYVDDVFSSFMYRGNQTARSINNGIDLDGEGGLVWVKSTSSRNHILADTANGTGKVLFSNLAGGIDTDATTITSFNSNGFSMGTSTLKMNTNSETFCSWTFRKCPGFFDIVTYTGNATSGRTIAHNLGSVPGSIWVKRLNGSDNWTVYHRGVHDSSPEDYTLYLNTTDERSDQDLWADTAPTDSVFSVGDNVKVNGNDSNTYVAYLFAHNDGSFGEDSDEAVIKCGSWTGSGTKKIIDVGFEPQWLMVKSAYADSDHWYIYNSMSGFFGVGALEDGKHLRADASFAQGSNNVHVTSDGFQLDSADTNKSGKRYIYIAIRRPHKPPETGTDVFAVDTKSAISGETPNYSSNFPVDFCIRRNNVTSTDSTEFITRLGNTLLYTNSTAQEVDGSSTFLNYFSFNNGWGDSSVSDTNDYLWMFKRAPGFMDVTTWEGDGVTGRTVNHNLTVAPEFMLVKRRSGTENWYAYHKQPGATESAFLNTGAFGSSGVWNDTAPTATTITLLGDNAVNGSGETYVGYFFATLAGISKVGSYTGTANAIDVDCGFTNGARFVLIKRTDDSTGGGWYYFDTTRGISGGSDPFLRLNVNNAQGSADLIGPLDSGFSVASGTTNVNYDGGTYLFLAIA